MAVKKMRAKTRKGLKKRIKISKGGDIQEGKLLVNRINNARLHLKKSRTTKLRAKRDTVLSKSHERLRVVLG